jgi:hypothetical protein
MNEKGQQKRLRRGKKRVEGGEWGEKENGDRE